MLEETLPSLYYLLDMFAIIRRIDGLLLLIPIFLFFQVHEINHVKLLITQ